MSNMTDATREAMSAKLFGAHEITPTFGWVGVAQSFFVFLP